MVVVKDATFQLMMQISSLQHVVAVTFAAASHAMLVTPSSLLILFVCIYNEQGFMTDELENIIIQFTMDSVILFLLDVVLVLRVTCSTSTVVSLESTVEVVMGTSTVPVKYEKKHRRDIF